MGGLRTLFGVAGAPGRDTEVERQALEARQAKVARLGGEAAYWQEHLRTTRTAIALVNQDGPQGSNGSSLRWVPFGSTLLVPLPVGALLARSPMAGEDLGHSRAELLKLLMAEGRSGPPPSLDAYLAFVNRQLDRWRQQGAVAVKFTEAYQRSLRFEEVLKPKASALYARGLRKPLGREDYLALQDYLARYLFLACGTRKLPVHIHSSHGAGPFLRLQEADVRNLESVLAEPRFFGTQFVLIHGGAPQHEAAAYLASNKPHVWIDLSAMPFLYARTEMVRALRIYLLFAPERTLFGTDAPGAPTVPAGAEVTHFALSRHLRDCLTEALAELVEEGVWTEAAALEVGKGVLQGNARRLYGWP